MARISISRALKHLFAKTFITALSLVVNFTQAAEIKDSISEERPLS